MTTFEKARLLTFDLIVALIAGAALSIFTGCEVARQIPATAATPQDIPYGVAVNPATNVYYVANGPAGTISVIDGTTNKLTATIDVGMPVAGLAVNPTTNMLYATGNNLNTTYQGGVYAGDEYSGARPSVADPSLVVIDGKANIVVTTIANLGVPFTQMSVNPVTNKLYVTNNQSASNNNVYTLDGSTNQIVGQVQVGGNAAGLAVNTKTNLVYVSTTSGSLAVVNGSTNAATTASSVTGDVGVAVDESSDTVYAINTGTSQVSIMNALTNQLIGSLAVGQMPVSIAINSVTHRLYIANKLDSTVTVIDSAANVLLATIPVGGQPVQVAVNSTANVVYVLLGDHIVKIDGTTNQLL